MPKTYNQRQIDQMRLEDEHAPPVRDVPDPTRHVRYFSPEEIAGIVERMMKRIALDKPTHLKPDTAYLVARALRSLAATPDRRAIVREICGIPGGYNPQCLKCIGKANAVMALYEGRKVR